MVYIENDLISVAISPKGGTLWSVKGKETGIEYLWQGDPAFWGGTAPNLFPIVGRLFGNEYTWESRRYSLNCHGFLRDLELRVDQAEADSCTFVLEDSEQTREVYPFAFRVSLRYRLEGRRLVITWDVKNRGQSVMHCAIGGHPGFNVPLEEDLRFEDYRLRFDEKAEYRVVEFSDHVLTLGEKPYALQDGRILPLRRELFAHDAVVLTNCSRKVTLESDKGRHGVTVCFPDMPYVGFWQVAKPDTPYLCVEPWSALPGREGVTEDLSTIPGFYAIQPGESVKNEWSIEVF